MNRVFRFRQCGLVVAGGQLPSIQENVKKRSVKPEGQKDRMDRRKSIRHMSK
jgi:hypothetical protein